MRTSRRVVLMSGAAAALAACARDPEPVVTPTPTPSPTLAQSPTPSPSPSPTLEPVQPLTGRPLSDASVMERPAVALKVPNLKQEQPQVGLLEADIVFCQVNGHAYTRLLPVYHSTFPEAVGPIRSMRPVDVPLLAPMRPVLGNTGAADWVLAYVDDHATYIERMTYLDWRGTGAYSINQDRLYRYNGKTQYDRAIQAHPARMAELAERNTKAPKRYFPFATTAAEASTASGESATTAQVPYGSGHTYDMSYEYDDASATYLRSQPWGEHLLADGARVTADAVLVVHGLFIAWALLGDSYLAALKPEYDPGTGTALSWLLLLPWCGSLLHMALNGRKRFTPNEIGEFHFGEGSELTDRTGLRFRTKYRDVLETILTFGGGDLIAVDNHQNVIKRWDNIVGLYFLWSDLDRVLHQRAAVMDMGEEKVTVEQ